MTAIFRTEADRMQAIELRRLLLRLQNGEGEDRPLGADIVTAIGAPAALGDPTGCLDCALYLADYLKMPRIEALAWSIKTLRDRVREGWKAPEDISHADAARALTIIVVKGQIARLEGAPV